MFEQLNFEAEPFEFESGFESARLRRRRARWRVPADEEFESGGGGTTVPPKPPKGLVLLRHFHIPKSLPGAGRALMNPAGMNPGFVNAADQLVTGTLHARLQALMVSTYKKRAGKISLALVDLTGKRLFAPDLAGWRSTVASSGASLPKIAPLYAVHQLRFDLQVCADFYKLTTKKALVEQIRKEWSQAGLNSSQQPDLDELFKYTEAPPKPVAVEPSDWLVKVSACTIDGDCNWSASLLIDRVGFGYMGSALWQSGLFHHARGGLWLTTNYGDTCKDCSDFCCDVKSKVRKATKPVGAPPAKFGQNATALSAATYFTLMAQGRLADAATSGHIRKALEPGCSLFLPLNIDTPKKCGFIAGVFNEVMLRERDVGIVQKPKVIRYVIAVMTNGALSSDFEAQAFFTQLKADAERLIQQNNP
jgi:hypothetical protein